MSYQTMVRETLRKIGRRGIDPRHVEAFMRNEYGTLDHLGGLIWYRAVAEAADCVEAGGAVFAEQLADAIGLRPEAL
jgi:hypothetical protein